MVKQTYKQRAKELKLKIEWCEVNNSFGDCYKVIIKKVKKLIKDIKEKGCGEEFWKRPSYRICSGVDERWGIFLLCPKCIKTLDMIEQFKSVNELR